jgi:hypothetical protein
MTDSGMWSPQGLAYYLHMTDEVGSGRYGGHEPRVGVTIGTTTVYVRETDLYCTDCDDAIEPTRRAPARFLACNRILTGGRCADCR